jgi:hypothetical protein
MNVSRKQTSSHNKNFVNFTDHLVSLAKWNQEYYDIGYMTDTRSAERILVAKPVKKWKIEKPKRNGTKLLVQNSNADSTL